MGAMDQKGAKICSQPREEIQWDSGAHCGHSASHLAAGTDGGHQTPSGSGRRDWYLKDCHHSQLPQDPQYRNTCKIQYEFHLKLNITESNLICVSWLFYGAIFLLEFLVDVQRLYHMLFVSVRIYCTILIFIPTDLLPLQMLLNMNFSSRTSSLDVQRNLEANVEKRTKDTYGPPPGRRLLIFIDDMNMPQVGFNEPMYRIYVYFTHLVKSFKASYWSFATYSWRENWKIILLCCSRLTSMEPSNPLLCLSCCWRREACTTAAKISTGRTWRTSATLLLWAKPVVAAMKLTLALFLSSVYLTWHSPLTKLCSSSTTPS